MDFGLDSFLVLEDGVIIFEKFLVPTDGDSKGDAGTINDGDARPVHKILGLTAMLYCVRLGVSKMTLEICTFVMDVQNLIYVLLY